MKTSCYCCLFVLFILTKGYAGYTIPDPTVQVLDRGFRVSIPGIVREVAQN